MTLIDFFFKMWGNLSKVSRILQPLIFNNYFRNASKSFSILSSPSLINSPQKALTSSHMSNILQPASIFINIQRGMKQVGRVKRRCRDCYFMVRDERLFVLCKTHPRHKQMSIIKKKKNQRFLTDATQSVVRAW